MSIEDFVYYQKSEQGIKDIVKLWNDIKSNYLKETSLYLEWLIWRIILSLGINKNNPLEITNTKLDKDFNPISCAAKELPDLDLLYKNMRIACEVTERPIPGYIEHYFHVYNMEKKYKIETFGLLISRLNVEDIIPETWNTYKGRLDSIGPLFMITDVEFLVKILHIKDNPQKQWDTFIKESKAIWNENKNWKDIKGGIISLQQGIINGGY